MVENECVHCLRKPGGIFNGLQHSKELPVNSLVILVICLPLLEGASFPCLEAVATTEAALQLIWGRFGQDCQSLPPHRVAPPLPVGTPALCRPGCPQEPQRLSPVRPRLHLPPSVTLRWRGILRAWESWSGLATFSTAQGLFIR